MTELDAHFMPGSDEDQQTKSLLNAALSCGKKVAYAGASFSAVGFGGAWYISNTDLVSQWWLSLLHAVSFGGRFWPSALSGLIGLAVCCWVLCVFESMTRSERSYALAGSGRYLAFVGVLGAVLWSLNAWAIAYTFAGLSSLSAYQAVALIGMWMPLAVGVFLAFSLVLSVLY